jgi:hypothetical protein
MKEGCRAGTCRRRIRTESREDTSSTGSQSGFADLDGWNEIISKDIIQSALDFKFVVGSIKELFIPTIAH